MTDKKDEQKIKKLTLGGSKLSLGNKSVYPKKPGHTLGSSSVVVEIKRGKVTSGGLSLKIGGASAPTNNQDQDDRRLAALQKSKEEKTEDAQISTLSKLNAINQELQTPVVNETIPVDEQNTVADKSSVIKKEYTKLASVEVVKEKEKTEEEAALVKPKNIEPKKLKKSDIINMLDQDSGNIPFKTRSLASIKRSRAKEKRKNSGGDNKAEKLYREVILPEVITVAELASRMTERASDVTRELMKLGVMATSNQSIDADTAELIIASFGHTVKHVKESDIENILIDTQSNPENLKARAPIVTVMGHVDHGKTSLLDALKETDIVGGEAGGITQHIGAYTVIKNGQEITFVDTPGHEAFSAMRVRGASVTDIIIIVVAADDGVKPQTIESIKAAKASGAPIIVAVNKIDKETANIDMVKAGMAEQELSPSDWGGDIEFIGVSALSGAGIDDLLENIIIQSDLLELKADPTALAKATVIESQQVKGKGAVATVIVQNGTLKIGDNIVADTTFGRVKALLDDQGKSVQELGLSRTGQVVGLSEVPLTGSTLVAQKSAIDAKEIATIRAEHSRAKELSASTKVSLDEMAALIAEGKIKALPVILKADAGGSLEAIKASLETIKNDEVKVKIISSGVGGITEADIALASASDDCIILGFNVRPTGAVKNKGKSEGVEIKTYSIIYALLDDIKLTLSGMMSAIVVEENTGQAQVLETFVVPKIGTVAGCKVTDGKVVRGGLARVIRDGIVIYTGAIKSLKRFKDDVKEVSNGYECGIIFESNNDIQANDYIETFIEHKEEQKID